MPKADADIKIQFSHKEARALFSLIQWAMNQGYHPYTEHGKQSPLGAPARFAAAKISMALGEEFEPGNH